MPIGFAVVRVRFDADTFEDTRPPPGADRPLLPMGTLAHIILRGLLRGTLAPAFEPWNIGVRLSDARIWFLLVAQPIDVPA